MEVVFPLAFSSPMRFVLTCFVSLLLLVVGARVEERASFCGMWPAEAVLPYGLRAEWFNGWFWIKDQHGFTVISPVADTLLDNGQAINVVGIGGYLLGREVLVRVTQASGVRGVIVVGPPRIPMKVRSVTLGGPELEEIVRDDPSWIDVAPSDCFYGEGGLAVLRCLLFAAFVALWGVAWQVRRREKTTG